MHTSQIDNARKGVITAGRYELIEENKAKARVRYQKSPKRRPLYATATRPIPKKKKASAGADVRRGRGS